MTHPKAPQRWRPAKLGPADTTVLSLIVGMVTLIRGYDYLTGDDVWRRAAGEAPPALVGVEGAFPLWVWGIVFTVSSLVLFVGMAKRWHFWVFLGHAVLGLFYAGLLVGLMAGYLSVPNFDGIRGAAGTAMKSAYCLIIASRMGSRPLELWKS